MCDDHGPGHYDTTGDPNVREDHGGAREHSHPHDHDSARRDPSRRLFLGGAALLVAGGAATGLGIVVNRTDGEKSPIAGIDGRHAYSQAMHIHTSFSEGPASYATHINQAEINQVDILWKTDHDWRSVAHGAPEHIGFDSIDSEVVAGGRPVLWRPMTDGAVADQSQAFVASPANAANSANGSSGSMRLAVTSARGQQAKVQYYADFSNARVAFRTNLNGQTWSIDVLPRQAAGEDGYLELLVSLSYHPPIGGRPAGRYQLAYRFGTAAGPARAQQLLGIVPKPVPLNQWSTVELDPIADIKTLWPDLAAEDNSMYEFWLGAASTNGTPVEGYFDNMNFRRTKTAPKDVLATETALMDRYRPGAKVQLERGHEVSFYERHITAFGTDFLPDYSDQTQVSASDPGWHASTELVKGIHDSGGIASFNHPFGTRTHEPSSPAAQAAGLAYVFDRVFKFGACGADIFEVGFQERGGLNVHGQHVIADIHTHQALWDMMSRNGFFLTGNGVTDDHFGTERQWAKGTNRFLTYTWSTSSHAADLLASLAAGRAWVAEMVSFRGTLDLLVDGIVQMGQASLRPGVRTRQLEVQATGLPAGSAVHVVQGPMDYPGAQTSGPGTRVAAQLPAADLSSGSRKVAVDTRASTFVRVDVVDRSGRTIAFSNPVYLLQRAPAHQPVPSHRRSADSAD